MADEDVKRALMEALGMGQRPRPRPEGMGSRIPPVGRGMGESGKTISDADKLKMMMMQKRKDMDEMPDMSPEQMKMLELMMKQQQGVRDKAERKAFPPPSMMNRGGKVMGYEYGGVVGKKKKPKMGAVMAGRGGSFKGIK